MSDAANPLWPALRTTVLLTACAGIVAALARPPLAPDARLFVLLVVAGVAAWSARSALLLLAARKGRLVVDGGAPTHRLALATLAPAVVAVAVGAAIAYAPLPDQTAVVVTGLAGALLGAAAARARDKRAKGPRATSKLAWLLIDTALPAGLIAALVSVAVGMARLHALDTVGPTEIARHLAATTFAYAFFLGLGGFLKAFGERTAGLVTLDAAGAGASMDAAPAGTRGPGPVLAGGILGVVILFVGPRVLPSLPLDDVLMLKGGVGLVVGGGLSLLGALQGARAAGLKKRG